MKCKKGQGGCFIQKALDTSGVKNHPRGAGTLTESAKQHGMSVAAFAKEVDKNPSKYHTITHQRVNLYHNLMKSKKLKK
tara:strand:- start:654 stop:890 length:237 start_codon:yes stop_codon:yes gene_type:complete